MNAAATAARSGATVIVTRPEADAGRLVDALRRRGRPVIALPVIAIEPVADPSTLIEMFAALDRYRLVVFVSPNAIRQALAVLEAPWPRAVSIGVMGPGSVDALRDVATGESIRVPMFDVISPADDPAAGDSPRFDSEGLFAALDARLGIARGFDGRVLIVRGNGGRAWLADRLRGLGIAVNEVEAYRRVRPIAEPQAADALAALVRDAADAVVVLTSSEGVEHLVAIVEAALAVHADIGRDAARRWLFTTSVVAPHPRIAERATDAGFTRVTLCAPGDSGIVAALE